MLNKKENPFNLLKSALYLIIIGFIISPIAGMVLLCVAALYTKTKYPNYKSLLTDLLKSIESQGKKTNKSADSDIEEYQEVLDTKVIFPKTNVRMLKKPVRLEKRKRYLQIALNSSMQEAGEITLQLPESDRILIEAGTPLIKIYGTEAITRIRRYSHPGSYVVADNKCADLALREVEMMAKAGANASTCLGVSPIQTIERFISECERYNIDSMIDMMNVENPLFVLKKLKKQPNVVMLHRGVDETEFSKEKQIPYYQIKQIKGNYNVLVAVAGGDTIREVQRSIFNDADIVVVWKNFYQVSGDTANLADMFLKEIG